MITFIAAIEPLRMANRMSGHARLMLLQTDMSVLGAALACGFVSASHFSKCYREYFGKPPPTNAAKRHKGRTYSYLAA